MSVSHVDKRIKSLQKKIRQLNNDRNTIVPISRLPVEVLSEIFLFLAALIPYEEDAKKRPGWIAITYVCQRWRSVALGCPHLWSSISFTHLCDSWVLASFERARDVPLDFSLRDHAFQQSTPIPLAVALITGCMVQVRSIDLVGCQCLNGTFEELIDASETVDDAPILETLRLEAPSEHIHTMPSNFLVGSVPKLRRISLSNWVPESWNSSFLDGLTHLKIHTKNAPPPSPVEFFKALERLVAVSELDLDIKLPDMDKVVEGRHDICFGQMTQLTIGKRPMAKVAGLLRLLHIPHTSKVTLHCEFNTGDDLSVLQRFSTAFRTSCLSKIDPSRPSTDPVIKFLAVEYRRLDSYAFRMSFDDPAVGARGGVSHHIQLYGTGNKSALHPLLVRLPVSEVRSLHIRAMVLPTPWIGRSLLQQFPHVHTLFLGGSRASEEFLNPSHWDADTMGLSQNYLLPALRHLELFDADFKYGNRRPGALEPASLVHFLKNRKNSGSRVEKLVMKDSYTFKKDRSMFKGLCGEIEWEYP
ncbi:hypothetical protein BKA70DRAFT_1487733 [Coprinopsis sp. MPI-PUGE-AT-0042]|nr:hypothetical protein BKA70DRAFT_1487733 [Coprinopsis sp. MPI-PUGE-AT-0042]